MLPKYLYKYRTYSDSNHRRILTHNEIFFTSARRFNDPFDCFLPIRIEELTRNDILERMEFLLRQENPSLSPDETWKKAKHLYEQRKPKSPKTIKESHEFQRKYVADRFGICSLSAESRNIVMWSHYADSHRGFCVRFNTKNLQDFCINKTVETNTILDLKKVIYAREYPILIPTKMMADFDPLSVDKNVYVKALLTKSSNWKYEKEWRLFMYGFTDKAINLPDGIIDGVILGCQMNENTVKEILKICSAKSDLKVYKAKMQESNFGLDFVEPT